MCPLRADPPLRIPGTAVFLSANPGGAPAALLANIKYNCVIHERVLLLRVTSADVPHVPARDLLTVEPLGHGLYRGTVRAGFMQDIRVPTALQGPSVPGLELDPLHVPYFVSRTRVIASKVPGMALWRERLYSVMPRNAVSTVDFFGLPAAEVFEIGTSVEV